VSEASKTARRSRQVRRRIDAGDERGRRDAVADAADARGNVGERCDDEVTLARGARGDETRAQRRTDARRRRRRRRCGGGDEVDNLGERVSARVLSHDVESSLRESERLVQQVVVVRLVWRVVARLLRLLLLLLLLLLLPSSAARNEVRSAPRRGTHLKPLARVRFEGNGFVWLFGVRQAGGVRVPV
jgi:hypothetical protein